MSLSKDETNNSLPAFGIDADVAVAAIQAFSEGLVVQDSTGMIVGANPAAVEILGLPIDQLMGRDSIDSRWRAIHEDGNDYPGETHPAMITLTTGEPVNDAVMGVHRPVGSLVWLSVSSRPFSRPNGERWVVVAFVDDTERRTAWTRARGDRRFAETLWHSNASLMSVLEVDGTLRTCNPALEAFLGVPLRDLVGKRLAEHENLGNDRATAERFYTHLSQNPRRYSDRSVIRTPNGKRTMMWTITPVLEHGQVQYFVTNGQDVTELEVAVREARSASARLEVIFDRAPFGTAMVGLSQSRHQILQANWALAELIGLSTDDLLACTMEQLVTEPYRDLLEAELNAMADGANSEATIEVVLATMGDTERWASVTISALIDEDGTTHAAIAQFEDITAVREREALLRWQSTHDPLTELANRSAFTGRVAAVMADERSRQSLAVMFCDLDGFKSVNDTLGHAAGDALLREVARRLKAAVRPGDLVARLGGDEFIVLLERVPTTVDIECIAQRTVDHLAMPVDVHGTMAAIGVSIGVARPTSASIEELMLRADAAMYEAKRRGKSCFVHAD
ncbi:MAG: diguanylate cyclase [Acidimicrobiia bacterium]